MDFEHWTDWLYGGICILLHADQMCLRNTRLGSCVRAARRTPSGVPEPSYVESRSSPGVGGQRTIAVWIVSTSLDPCRDTDPTTEDYCTTQTSTPCQRGRAGLCAWLEQCLSRWSALPIASQGTSSDRTLAVIRFHWRPTTHNLAYFRSCIFFSEYNFNCCWYI